MPHHPHFHFEELDFRGGIIDIIDSSLQLSIHPSTNARAMYHLGDDFLLFQNNQDFTNSV